MTDEKRMWMVRAGKGGVCAELFEYHSIVAISWDEIRSDLTQAKDKSSIQTIIEKVYPEHKKGWKSMAASQISKFCFDIQKNDKVMTYHSDKRVYMIGTVSSELKFKKDVIESFNHYRRVKWEGEIQRDDLSPATKNTLGAISTLFAIPDDSQEELFRLLAGDKTEPDIDIAKEAMENLRLDTIEKSREFIKDKLIALDWEDMQELVAGILRAMGYKTRVSPRGPDRGVDISASPDGLGLETPRIFVEVKHRLKEKIKSKQVRSLIGGRNSGDSCLYVSTGGFTKDAYYEAERSSVPLTLLNADDLVKLLISNYENVDNDTKALVPLIKLYWPA
jgi:restriction system protein